VGATAIHWIDWKNGFGDNWNFIVDKSLWGKGLGRELMQLRTRYAFTQLPLRKLKSAYSKEMRPAPKPSRGRYREVGAIARTFSLMAGGETT